MNLAASYVAGFPKQDQDQLADQFQEELMYWTASFSSFARENQLYIDIYMSTTLGACHSLLRMFLSVDRIFQM